MPAGDPIRASVGSRTSTDSFVTARASLSDILAPPGSALQADAPQPHRMASLSLTLPPAPSRAHHSERLPDGDILYDPLVQAGHEPTRRLTQHLDTSDRASTVHRTSASEAPEGIAANLSDRSDSIQEGLQAAERVGVKAAKLNFWSKLVGATLAGLGVVAFGVLTGGVSTLALAGLAVSSLYFMKASADVHMSRLHLQNARAIQAGQDPPHNLPCGPDAVAHFIFKWAEKRIPENASEAERDVARAKAMKWATVASIGIELSLGLASVAISGSAFDKLAVSLASFFVRVGGSFLSQHLSNTNPTRYQQESIDLAKTDLDEMQDEINAIQPLPPEDSSDPVRLHDYQNQTQHLEGLRAEFASVREKFEQSLRDYEEGIESISPVTRSESRLANAAAVSAGMDVTDFVEIAATGQSYYLGVLATVGATGAHAMLNNKLLNTQERLENALTQALLDMNEGLKSIARHAALVRAMAPAI